MGQRVWTMLSLGLLMAASGCDAASTSDPPALVAGGKADAPGGGGADWIFETRSYTNVAADDYVLDAVSARGHLFGFDCEGAACSFSYYPDPGDYPTESNPGVFRKVSAHLVEVTANGTTCSVDTTLAGHAEFLIDDDGGGGTNYSYGYNWTFGCADTLSIAGDDGQSVADTLQLAIE